VTARVQIHLFFAKKIKMKQEKLPRQFVVEVIGDDVQLLTETGDLSETK